MTYKRRGSIRFITFGRFGFSFWLSKRKPITYQRYSEYADREVDNIEVRVIGDRHDRS